MHLAGMQKLTLLDFPGKTAATVFTPGCNFRCPFCHNAELVVGASMNGAKKQGLEAGTRLPGGPHESAASGLSGRPSESTSGDTPDHAPNHAPGSQSGGASGDQSDDTPVGQPSDLALDEVFSFLEKRRGLLDGVCITGGEPLLQPGIAEFCARVRERGFAVKLDTNGSFPDRLRALVEAGLVDYVAMDVKNAPSRYAETVGAPASTFDLAPVRASIDFLLGGSVPFEFRTTVVRELHSAESLVELARWIEGAPAWFLQSFIDKESVLGGAGRFHAWPPDELRALLPHLQAIVPAAALRGV